MTAPAPRTAMPGSRPVLGEFHYPLGQAEFATIARCLQEAAGITLGESKRELVQGRLARRLRALGCPDFPTYLDIVMGPDGDAERQAMINALTTNLTGFFREPHHFEHLAREVLPEIARTRTSRRLRIWSAGCSSGEEPYSIAMTVHAHLPGLAGWDARILATDIDTNMVETARAGLYDANRTQRIPPQYRARYTEPGRRGAAVSMAGCLRDLLAFKPLNLFDPWPMKGPFDVVFCRNVVIYFDKPTQRRLFDRMADIVAPGGWLFIGHSESLFHVCDRFRHLGRTIYRKQP